MAASEQTPSPALLRLRPADVVRLCGLTAAAAGLELVASHSVIASHRDGNRLLATVNDAAPHAIRVEVADELDAVQWTCDCAHSGPLACAHVAATLSAWIAHPADFIIEGAETPETGSSDTANAPQTPKIPIDRKAHHADVTTLVAALARMNAATVDEIARRLLGEESVVSPEDARRKIVATLRDSSHLRNVLDRLESAARMLLTLLYLNGGAMTLADLEGVALRMERPLSAAQSDMAVLERHALALPVVSASVSGQHGPGSSLRHVAGWRIPDEVQEALLSPPLPLDPAPIQQGSRSAPPLIEPSGAPLHVTRSAPRALCLALALLASAPPPLGPPLAAPATVDAPSSYHGGRLLALAPGELAPERLDQLARSAGLDTRVVRLARRLVLQARERHAESSVADMARAPVIERPVVLRMAFRSWLRAASAADLLDMESPGAQVHYAPAHPAFSTEAIAREVSEARRFVVRLLSYAQPETWYSLERFLTLIWQSRPGLLRGQQLAWATPAWWLESPHDKRVLQPQVRADWMDGEGAFIQSLIVGAFRVWGMVDLATRADGAVAAFRVTPFGAYLLRRDNGPADASLAALCDADWGPPVLPLREGALAVQPLAADASLLDALALWAAPTAVSGKRLVYTLSADRACAAFDRNLSPQSLPALLRPVHSRAADMIARQLDRWHARWGHTRITTGYTLLEASDEAALVEALAAAPAIAARCKRIGPTLALAQPDDAAALRVLLAKRGYVV